MKRTQPRHATGPAARSRTDHASGRELALAACLALALAAGVIYFPSLGYPFLDLDDNKYVTENPLMHGTSLSEAATRAFAGQDYCYWHPLTVLSLYLDSRLFGSGPTGFRAVNVGLHGLNAVLLFLAFRRMTGRFWPSLLVASLFVAHPAHVESVAWITERKDVLSTFFWMLALLAYSGYARQRTLVRYGLIILALGLGLMAKPMLATLPAVLLLLDFWPLRRLWPEDAPSREPLPSTGLSASWLVAEKIPLLALGMASVAVSFATLTPEDHAAPFSLAEGLKNVAPAYLEYLRILVWPAGIGLFHPFPQDIPAWKWIGSTLALVGVTALALRAGRRRRFVAVGWLWFLGTMVPALKIYGGGLVYAWASRFSYIPFIGLYLVLAFGAEELARRSRTMRLLATAGAVLVVLALGLAARNQLGHWKDSATLFTHTLRVTKENPYMRYMLGLVRERRGDAPGAMQDYRLSLEQNPDYIPARLNLGNLLLERGRLAEAEEQFRAVLTRHPDQYYALVNLGVAAFLSGRTAEGEDLTRRAMDRDPGKALAFFNLGRMRAAARDRGQARELFGRALALDPGHQAARASLEALGPE